MTEFSRLDGQLENLKSRGVSLSNNTARARLEAHSMHHLAREGDLQRDVMSSYPRPMRARVERMIREGGPEVARIWEENNALAQAMGSRRMMSQRLARQREQEQRYMTRQSTIGQPASGMGGDAMTAFPRFYDPLEYYDLTGLPWNMADEGHRHKLHKWLRLYASTHYLVPTLIDIFTRFPLVGLELESKDKKLTQFYEDQFLGTLDYENFLTMVGKEYWTVGEAFTLGSFDEDIAVWEHEEFIQPEDVTIENFALLDSKQMKIVPPDHLKRLVQTKVPAKEYAILQEKFPDLVPFLEAGRPFPVSSVLMKQVGNILNPWDDHGTPILLRGLRTLLHEEKLLASQDAIAERLYSPLILAKLGIMDLGDGMGPWIPGPEELEVVRDDLDMALASDFRLMVHHFGLEIASVFGREQMPRLGEDFDRIERRIMQVFGVNPSLLSAGANSQPYASSALQAEFLNQILRTYQGLLKQHYRERALVVAEANEHYDYYKKGDKRIPIMERVVVGYDEEGDKIIDEVPKLLVPELKFSTLDLRDEATERQFLQTLRTMGVPIPDSKLMVGIPYDIDEITDEYGDELVTKTVNQQASKVKAYKILWEKGYPIPPDLAAEIQAASSGANPDPASMMPPGSMPQGPAAGGPGEAVVVPPPPAGLGPGGQGGPIPGGGPPPAGPVTGPAGTVPEISNERRPGIAPPQSATIERHADVELEPEQIWDMDDERFELGTFEELRDDGEGNQRVVAKIARKEQRKRQALQEKKYSIIDEEHLDPDQDDQETKGSSDTSHGWTVVGATSENDSPAAV